MNGEGGKGVDLVSLWRQPDAQPHVLMLDQPERLHNFGQLSHNFAPLYSERPNYSERI